MNDRSEQPLLAFDTSGSAGSLAVGTAGRAICEISLDVRGGLSSALLPAIDSAMAIASTRPTDLSGILVGAGPGSFTGLRVAAATAKGMAQALGIPLRAYSSLVIAAAPYASHPGPVGVLFDARGRDVFVACYEFRKEAVATHLAPVALNLDDAIARLAATGATLLIGDGASRHEAELTDRLRASVVPGELGRPRGAGLLWLHERYPAAGHDAAEVSWEPAYLRASGAERIAEERRTAARMAG